MKLVSNNSDDNLARADLFSTLGSALRELTGNLMRIAAGAGKPHLVGEQSADVVLCLRELGKLGASPTALAMQQMLAIEDRGARFEEEHPWETAMHKMILGGLRLAAADLLDQLPQRSAGETMLFEGLTVIEAIRESNRIKYQGASRRRTGRQKD